MNILLVEDNPAEAELATAAFEEVAGDVTITVIADGVEALSFVRREPAYQDTPLPDLMLLDLGLPRKDGRAVLEELKCDPELCRMPIIVLSNSHADKDIEQVYRLNGNCYLVKPPDLKGMCKLARSVVDFWSGVQRPSIS